MKIHIYTDLRVIDRDGEKLMKKYGYLFENHPLKDVPDFTIIACARHLIEKKAKPETVYVIEFESGKRIVEMEITACKLAEWNAFDFHTSPVPLIKFAPVSHQ